MSKERTHHEFSPSQSKRNKACSGSWKLSKLVPPPPQGEAAAEGEMLHEVVEMLFYNKEFKQSQAYIKLTPEQQLLVEKTIELLEKLDGDWVFEEELSLTDSDFTVITSGYVDCYSVKEKEGVIVDFKFGFVPVDDADKNDQLKIYAKMLLDKYGLDNVTVMIWQPRLNKLSKHTWSSAELDCVPNDELVMQERCKGNQMVLSPSPDTCRWCAAKSICPAFNQHPDSVGHELLKIEHTHELTAEKLTEYLSVADNMELQWKAVKKKIDALRFTATEKLMKGEAVPGWTLEHEKGDREITDGNGVWGACQGVVPQEEFMKLVKLPITKLEKLYATSKKKTAGGTLADAEREFRDKTKEFIGRKPDTNKLVRIDNRSET